VAVRKPKQSRSKATASSIVEAATQILAQGGWPAFNTNAIAKRAGVSIGSLYEYFPNKQALLDKIANAHLDDGEALVAAQVQKAANFESVAGIIETLVTALVRLHQHNPKLHRVLSSDAPVSEQTAQRAAQLRSTATELVQHALAPHVEDAALAGAFAFNTADTLIHQWHIGQDGDLIAPHRLKAELIIMLTAYLDAKTQKSRTL